MDGEINERGGISFSPLFFYGNSSRVSSTAPGQTRPTFFCAKALSPWSGGGVWCMAGNPTDHPGGSLMMRQFRARQTFFSPEMKSQYVEGLMYAVRTPQLAEMAQRWVVEGRAEWVRPGMSQLSGAAIVKPTVKPAPRSRWRRFVDFVNGGS